MTDEYPWRDADLLERLYHGEGLSGYEIADRLGCDQTTVSKWRRRHGIELREEQKRPEVGENPPWRDREKMYELYVERKMSAREISDHLGNPVNPRTINSWLHRLGIPTRSYKESRIQATLKSRKPTFYTDGFGYERWETRHRNEKFVVKVHRLLAVSEFGFDAVVRNHVHHKNGVRWDNRPDNIEVLTPSEHSGLHFEERDDISNEIGLIAQHGAEAVLGPNEKYGSKNAAREARRWVVPGGEADE